MVFSCRYLAIATLSISAGCATYAFPRECPRGQQEVDGQCLPSSTIVFRQCMESFRTRSVQSDRGKELEVGGKAAKYGEVSVKHAKTDRQRTEYADIPQEEVGGAIEECRRQEEAERSGQVARAYAEAEEARARAAQADRARDELARALERAERGEQEVEDALEKAREEYAQAQEELEALRASQGQAQELQASLEEAANELAQAQDRLAQLEAALHEQSTCMQKGPPRCTELASQAHAQGEFTRAHRLYALACGGAHGEACGLWGRMYEHGEGTDPDARAAALRYRRGCDLGSPRACVSLGLLLEDREPSVGPLPPSDAPPAPCQLDDPDGCEGLHQLASVR